MTEVKLSELTEFHSQWQQHPVTRQFIKLLDDMESNIVNHIAVKASEVTSVTDQEFPAWYDNDY